MKDSNGKIILKRLYLWILVVMAAASLIVSCISSIIAGSMINSYKVNAIYGDTLQDGYEENLWEFTSELYDAGFSFYYLLQQKNSKYTLTPGNVFWSNQDLTQDTAISDHVADRTDATATEASTDSAYDSNYDLMQSEDDADFTTAELSRMIKNAYATFADTMNHYNMHYFVISDDMKMSDVENATAEKVIKSLKDDGFYIRATFREDGTMSIAGQDAHCSRNLNQNISADSSEILSWIKDYMPTEDINFMNPMTIYIYSDSDQYYLDIENAMYANAQTDQFNMTVVFAYFLPAALICLIAIVAAWVLMGMASLDFRNSQITKISLEGSILLGLLSLLYIVFAPTCIYAQITTSTNVFHVRPLYFVLNTLFVFCCVLMLFIAAAGVAQIVILKPKRYFKERCIWVRLVRWLRKKVKGWYAHLKAEIEAIVMKGNYHRAIFMAVLINAAILAALLVICELLFSFRYAQVVLVGLFIILIYSFFLYRKAVRYVDKLAGQYDYLKNGVQMMAEGSLSVEFPENMGIFEPIANNLARIQDGVKVAVAEEVRSQKMKTELITNVSHDLKTPLTAIITYVNLLKEDNISEEDRKKYIDVLDLKSHRLKKLIEDLFEVSKADSGNVKVELSNIDVLDLIRQAAFEYEDKLNEAKIHMRLQLPDNKVMWMLDGQKMYRIFDNLIGNIVKYSVPGTRAYVTVNASEKELVITTKNISEQELPEDISSLTDRFVRGESSRHTEGSGLGLAIVQSFAQLQGGTFNLSVDGDLFKAELKFTR